MTTASDDATDRAGIAPSKDRHVPFTTCPDCGRQFRIGPPINPQPTRCMECLIGLEAKLAAAEARCAELERRVADADRFASENGAALGECLRIANERLDEVEAEKNAALQRAWSAEASLSIRVGMRREFEEMLGVSDTMEPGAFEAGVRRLRALLAAEAERDRYRVALREIADDETAKRDGLCPWCDEWTTPQGAPHTVRCAVTIARAALAVGEK